MSTLKEKIVIGFDLGAKAGISAIHKDIIYTHELSFKSKDEIYKYLKFYEHICKILDYWSWTDSREVIVYYEYVARHMGTKAAHAFGAYRVLLLMACYERDIPYELLSVQAIKKAATGKGNAKKDIMIEAATNRFNPSWELTDNEADSMWIAYLGRESSNESIETVKELPALKAIQGNGSFYHDNDRK